MTKESRSQSATRLVVGHRPRCRASVVVSAIFWISAFGERSSFRLLFRSLALAGKLDGRDGVWDEAVNRGWMAMAADRYDGGGRFPTTHWTLVAQVGRVDAREQREALGQLLVAYLPALRAHLIYGKRLSTHDAEDLLQEFVARKILEKDLIARADRELGKFRTFLLTALERFFFNWRRDQQAQKRMPQKEGLEALDEHACVAAAQEPARAFEGAWARNVIAQSLQQMQAECEASGRPEIWGVFQCRVLDPLLGDREPVDYQELVQRFGFASPSQASNVLMTAKRMYARSLRGVVAAYACEGHEIESEIAELKRVLAAGGGVATNATI